MLVWLDLSFGFLEAFFSRFLFGRQGHVGTVGSTIRVVGLPQPRGLQNLLFFGPFDSFLLLFGDLHFL